MGLQFPKASKAPAYVSTPPSYVNPGEESPEGAQTVVNAVMTESWVTLSSPVSSTDNDGTFAGSIAPGAH